MGWLGHRLEDVYVVQVVDDRMCTKLGRRRVAYAFGEFNVLEYLMASTDPGNPEEKRDTAVSKSLDSTRSIYILERRRCTRVPKAGCHT